MKKNVAVAIPVYKNNFTRFEQISLTRCFEVLTDYPIFFVKPQSLVLDAECLKYLPIFDTAIFDDKYFNGIEGYNKLMLSSHFYKRFLEYEYILIYQLDCFVFDDHLMKWTSKDYDYIGAPWLTDYKSPDLIKTFKEYSIRKYYKYINKRDKNNPGLPHKKQFENEVGNGGFSLRRINKFIAICDNFEREIHDYLSHTSHHYNEDVFFSIEVNRRFQRLKIPGCKIAAEFSLENSPERGMELTDGKLPFGCHDWEEYRDFWRPYFKDLGYTI